MTTRCPESETWTLVTRHDAAVVAALQEGVCDGILADDYGDPDDLIQLALDLGAFAQAETLPDRRRRHTHPQGLYARVLFAGLLVDARSLAAVGRTLFCSATVLDKLGVNYRQVREGGVRTGDERPFDVEALGDSLARLGPADYTTHLATVSPWLRQVTGRSAVCAVDAVDIPVPRGHSQDATHWKALVLSVVQPGGTHLPLAWRFGPAPQTHDRVLAKPLLQEVLTAWPAAQRPRVLLMDAGFLDGAWLRTLVDGGLTVVLQLRSDMALFELAVQAAAGEPARQWHVVALPARPAGSRVPVQRAVCGVTTEGGCDTYDRPMGLAVVQDTYADGTVDTWVIAGTDCRIIGTRLYTLYRHRWGIEECFMALSRYHHLNALGACREGLVLAKAHFTMLAETVRWVCRQRAQRLAGPGWRRRRNRFLVYVGAQYAILTPHALFQVAFAHWDRWVAHQEAILTALHYCQGPDD
jgi:hypothetical protein